MLKHYSEAVCILLLHASNGFTAVACRTERPSRPAAWEQSTQWRHVACRPRDPSHTRLQRTQSFSSL